MTRTLAIALSLALAGPFTLSAQTPVANPAAPTVAPKTVANALADRFESDFVYPDIGKRYATMLRANAAAGGYDALGGVALAEKLTADLLAVYPDGHVRVMHGTPDGPPPGGGMGSKAGSRPPAIEGARWIAPGIAFVRFNVFPPDGKVTRAAADFMATYAGAKTIIFDIRTHRGGGLDQMDVIFPWLFAKPTRLVTMATRESVERENGSPVAGLASMRMAEGEQGFVTREHWSVPRADGKLSNAKIYVLTSGRSASAAEHFALAMKHSGRGTLIGAPTAGANHFGGGVDLPGGFSAFIPVGRTYDPDTGKDWESNGVAPDIETAPEAALVKALTLSGVPQVEADRLSAEVAPTGPMERRKRS